MVVGGCTIHVSNFHPKFKPPSLNFAQKSVHYMNLNISQSRICMFIYKHNCDPV